MRKKLLSLSLIVAMIFNIALMNIPLAVSADENEVAFDYENYSIDYAIDTTYGNTQAIQVTITNTGDEIIENWMLAYDDFYGEVSEIWNGIVATTENGTDYIRNVGYNANIQPDSSVSFGYSLIDFTGTPSSIIMCQDRVTKENGYTAELNVVSEWGTAFNGEIILSNTTDNPIEWWEFTFDSNFTITEVTTSWAASVVDNGDGNYTFKGTYTGIVAPNSNVTLGFQAIKNGTPEIDNTSLTEVKFIENITNQYELKDDSYFKSFDFSATAEFDTTNEQITITWNSEIPEGTFEVFVSTDNVTYEAVEVVENTNSYNYLTDGDFVILYFKVAQNLLENPLYEDVFYSNICYAIYTETGTDWTDYLRFWDITDDNELLSEINNENEQYNLSVEFEGAGQPNIHLTVNESPYSKSIDNESILGIVPELNYNKELSLENIRIKFEIADEYLDNELNTLSSNAEFSGIKRLNIFKYFEDVNMLLPIETKFDISNNIIYADVDELGTYCVMDMEKWVEDLGIDYSNLLPDIVQQPEPAFQTFQSFSAPFQSFSNNDNTTTSDDLDLYDEETDVYREVPISTPQSSNVRSRSLQATRNSTVSMPTIETTSTTDDSLIDIVLMFQVHGYLESKFEEQKAMILSLSEAVFTTFPNARIYVLAVEDDGAEFLKDEDDNDFFTAESSMDSVENASFTQYEGHTDYRYAFQKIIDLNTNNSFRVNVPKYLYRIAYSSGIFASPNQLDMTDIPGVIYSEVRYELAYYNHDDFVPKVLGVSIDTNGICIMYDNNSAQIIYDHICNNIQYVEPTDTQIRLGLNWEILNLSTPITMGGTSDNDDDGLTDWEEIDSEFLSSYWEEKDIDVEINDELNSSNLPSIWYALQCHGSYMPFRYVNSNNGELLRHLNSVPTLPLISNPTKESSADDGVNDFDKMHPESIFDKYKSDFYDINDVDYDFYNDSEYFYERLDERYKQQKPFMPYTVENLFEELTSDDTNINIGNHETNPIYLKIKGNDIEIIANTNIEGDMTIDPSCFHFSFDSNIIEDYLSYNIIRNIFENKEKYEAIENAGKSDDDKYFINTVSDIKYSHFVMYSMQYAWQRNSDNSFTEWPSEMPVEWTDSNSEFWEGWPTEWVSALTKYSNDSWPNDGFLNNQWLNDTKNIFSNNWLNSIQDWNQGSPNFYSGSIFDFYPGMEITVSVSVVLKDYSEESNDSNNFLKVVLGENGGFAYPGSSKSAETSFYMGKNTDSITRWAGATAHEFGHTLGVSDAYPADGCGVTSKNEIRRHNGYYGIPFTGLLMWSNGIPTENEIEMLLYSFVENQYQSYNPSVKGMATALREKQVFNLNQYVNGEIVVKKHIWWEEKYFVPFNSEVREDENFLYFVDTADNEVGLLELLDNLKSNSSIVVPSSIDGYSVTTLNNEMFKDCINLASITLPNTITAIGANAFNGCINLESINLPNIARIETGTFYGCENLSNITIPNSVLFIGNSAFYRCQAIGNITIPASVQKIEAYAFNQCWLNNYGTITFNSSDSIAITGKDENGEVIDGYGYDKNMLLNCGQVTLRIPPNAENIYKSIFSFGDDRFEII